MKLITNCGANDHLQEILECMKSADSVCMAVAFLKTSGLMLLTPAIRKMIDQGKQISILCGLDFALTEPAALLELNHLFNDTSSSLRLFSSRNNQVFHPKLFLIERGNTASVIIGSANLTCGGMKKNEECSLAISVTKVDNLYSDTPSYFERIWQNAEEATMVRILKYKEFYDKQVIAKTGTREKPAIEALLFDQPALEEWRNRYDAEDPVEGNFVDKTLKYQNARLVLESIRTAENLSVDRFTNLFEQLVGAAGIKALWHSGSIYRKKTLIFNQQLEFQNLVRFIHDNSHKSPSFVFDGAKAIVQGISGSGVNTVTEIMMTYNPGKFANLNDNPITVLRRVAIVQIPAHRNTFNGRRYQLYCELIQEISNELGLRNMLEADSFFNFIFWKLEDD